MVSQGKQMLRDCEHSGIFLDEGCGQSSSELQKCMQNIEWWVPSFNNTVTEGLGRAVPLACFKDRRVQERESDGNALVGGKKVKKRQDRQTRSQTHEKKKLKWDRNKMDLDPSIYSLFVPHIVNLFSCTMLVMDTISKFIAKIYKII